MPQIYRQGAIGALLNEYEKAIIELRQVIADVTDIELVTIADPTTADPDCVSIQTIMHHVGNSGFGYATYVRRLKNPQTERPQTNLQTNVIHYNNNLQQMFAFTVDTFANIDDEIAAQSEKIYSSWGVVYDVEQLMEHAIVHILRHRRQIEKFKTILYKN